jgi:hypothetical protein
MLKFDADNHIYTAGGVRVPSVTQLLPEQKYFCTPEQLEAARVDGVDNHAMIKMFLDTGETYGEPYLIAFAEWLKSAESVTGPVVQYETMLYSKKHRYAGTPDIICQNGIIDIKRSFSNAKQHALQIAGYMILAKENNIIPKNKIWLIAWYDGQEFKAKNVFNIHAEAVFMSLVSRWHIDATIKNYMEAVA